MGSTASSGWVSGFGNYSLVLTGGRGTFQKGQSKRNRSKEQKVGSATMPATVFICEDLWWFHSWWILHPILAQQWREGTGFGLGMFLGILISEILLVFLFFLFFEKQSENTNVYMIHVLKLKIHIRWINIALSQKVPWHDKSYNRIFCLDSFHVTVEYSYFYIFGHGI